MSNSPDEVCLVCGYLGTPLLPDECDREVLGSMVFNKSGQVYDVHTYKKKPEEISSVQDGFRKSLKKGVSRALTRFEPNTLNIVAPRIRNPFTELSNITDSNVSRCNLNIHRSGDCEDEIFTGLLDSVMYQRRNWYNARTIGGPSSEFKEPLRIHTDGSWRSEAPNNELFIGYIISDSYGKILAMYGGPAPIAKEEIDRSRGSLQSEYYAAKYALIHSIQIGANSFELFVDNERVHGTIGSEILEPLDCFEDIVTDINELKNKFTQTMITQTERTNNRSADALAYNGFKHSIYMNDVPTQLNQYTESNMNISYL